MRSQTPSRPQKEISATVQEAFRQAVALHQQGRFAEAEAIYQDILRQDPTFFEALHLLGVVALQTRKTQESVELITKAIALNPNVAAAHINLGSALIALTRFAEALPSFDSAIALRPDFAEAHNNRAAALNALKRHEQALKSCDNALALKPHYPEAHNNRADALNALKRHEEALTGCDRAIALKFNYPEAHNNRGNALNALARHEEAVASYDTAIALNANYAEAYNNRGNALYNLAHPEQALASYEKAVALKPDYAEAHNNYGNASSYLKQCETALVSYDKAIALKPDYAEAHFNKSLLLLLMGRFEQGWPLYEWRKRKANPIAARQYRQPLWKGERNIAGKTVLLYEEQGLGDTIQFCRYAKLVADLGAKVILEAPPQLARLLGTLSQAVQIVDAAAPLPDFDYQSPLLSLPLAFKTELSNIPANIPYLKADPEKSRSWKDKLGEKTKARVGLVWSGGIRPNQPVSVNKRRNIPLSVLAPLKNPNIDFYSLQKGQPGEAELGELKRSNWNGPEIIDFASQLNDFSDTAALMENLDLLITVDTSTAHLAGALGKPVWILNRFETCWRWLLERTDSPWYPTAKLYRQEKSEDWTNVIQRVKTDLVSFQRSSA
ncbi:MAG: tetratricopeptide repeat protein [Pseudolabrys sp.]